MESILVTGGAGFIGSNIAEALLAKGHRVVILDDLSTGKMENVLDIKQEDNLKFVKGSILDRGLLRSILKTENVSLISHQAAVSSVTKSIADPVATMETNVAGTTNLFHIAAECGCRRIVFASSSAVYGDTPELPKRETMTPCPKSPYAMSKVAKEMLGSIFSDLYGISIIGLRYFNVYGRRQDPASDYAAVIPKFIAKALDDETIPIDGDGGQTRDFIYIDDVVNANIAALTGNGVRGTVFNVGNGKQTSILELARTIVELTGSKSEIDFKPKRAGDIRDSVSDIEYSQKNLGYRRTFTIKKGLAETISWYRQRVCKECVV
jgi:UDP-N-acetylglucosamine/UDP-N-acetyl-alpha-D-glucosaminouronate 4-epimerase